MIQVGQYGYRVVNGEEYRKIRDDDARREYQANWQRKNRAKMKANGEKIDGFDAGTGDVGAKDVSDYVEGKTLSRKSADDRQYARYATNPTVQR